MDYMKDVAVVIVSRNRPDLADALVEQLRSFDTRRSHDIFVVEMGSDPDKRSRYCSYFYPDSDFGGKAAGHVKGYEWVRDHHGPYRYYWFVMNDLVFRAEPNPIDTLTDLLEGDPRLGLISPTEADSGYPGSRPASSRNYHLVTTCDYLAIMMKSDCLEEVGFFNPAFKYSWGAIHELSHKMYRAGWTLAYCDKVVMKHLGGTTYGKVKGTISRAQYKENARQWAADYFRQTYGPRWDEEFSLYLPEDIHPNTYRIHRRYWEGQDETARPTGRANRLVRAALKRLPGRPSRA